jgi:hypothetical protein
MIPSDILVPTANELISLFMVRLTARLLEFDQCIMNEVKRMCNEAAVV